HLLGAAAVIRAVVVHERPAIAEPERLERSMNVGRAVCGIDRARVLYRIVDALAGVLDVEDVVAERAQPQEIHQRAPGDAAERIARDDAREQDFHVRSSGPGSWSVVDQKSANDDRATNG